MGRRKKRGEGGRKRKIGGSEGDGGREKKKGEEEGWRDGRGDKRKKEGEKEPLCPHPHYTEVVDF